MLKLALVAALCGGCCGAIDALLAHDSSIVLDRLKPAQLTMPPHGLCTLCRVTGIVDGDTVDVEVVWKVRVRLADCWAPETRTRDAKEKALGLRAKANIEALALGKDATLWVPSGEADSFGDVTTLGRVIGYVQIEGDEIDLSQRQVQAKLAASRKGEPLGR